MQRMINGCYERGKQVLLEHEKEVHLIAQSLLEKETLDLDQIKSLIDHGKIIDLDDGSADLSVTKVDEVRINIGKQSHDESNKLAIEDKEKNDSE
jgi:cell division protease FtsH